MLNRAHLILKEWPKNKALLAIEFDIITFFIQVHDLPPCLFNEKNALKIESTMGTLLQVNIKLVVAYRYLRLRVDIPIEAPLAAGFKHGKESLWKYGCNSTMRNFLIFALNMDG